MTHSFVRARVSPSRKIRERLLAESWQLVEEGVLSEADFKAWTFEGPYKLYTEAKSQLKPEAAAAAE